MGTAKPIEFTFAEIWLIEKSIAFDAIRENLEGTMATTDELQDLALKIGWLVTHLEFVDEQKEEVKPLTLSLTEKECWYIREHIDPFTRISGEGAAEGMSIKTKVYEALLQFEAENIASVLPAETAQEPVYKRKRLPKRIKPKQPTDTKQKDNTDGEKS